LSARHAAPLTVVILRAFSTTHELLWNTGSPAFAGDDEGAPLHFIFLNRTLFPSASLVAM
jgi:hypothetical protein